MAFSDEVGSKGHNNEEDKTQLGTLAATNRGKEPDVLTLYEQRHGALRELFKVYVLQLRYGCKSKHCTQPHCLGSKLSNTSVPLRRPTATTARMQAMALVSTVKPLRALCRHEPRYKVEDFDSIECPETTHEPVAKAGAQLAEKRDLKSLSQTVLSTEALNTVGGADSIHRIPDSIAKAFIVTPSEYQIPLTVEQLSDWRAIAAILNPPEEHERGVYLRLRNLIRQGLQRLQPCRNIIYVMLSFAVDALVHKIPHNRSRQNSRNEPSNDTAHLALSKSEALNVILICFYAILVEPVDYENPLAVRLVEKLFASLATGWTYGAGCEHHRCNSHSVWLFEEVSKAIGALGRTTSEYLDSTGNIIRRESHQRTPAILQHVLRQRWDGNWTLSTDTAFVYILDCFQNLASRGQMKISESDPLLPVDHFDWEVAKQFIKDQDGPGRKNLLEYHFLFPRSIFSYFRAVNYTRMLAAYRDGGFIDQMMIHFHRVVSEDNRTFLHRAQWPQNTRYLSLELRRDHLLEDAFNQLRGWEKRMFLRPLKVTIGEGEGYEIGVDQGGISQEFFRLALVKAFDGDYGMFVTDEISKVSFIRRGSPVEMFKFQLLGLIFSLALYNGATVNANLPLTLYRRLRGDDSPQSLDAIREDWPAIYRSLNTVRTWTDDLGKFEDVLALQFHFTTEDDMLLKPRKLAHLHRHGDPNNDAQNTTTAENRRDVASKLIPIEQCPTQNPSHTHNALDSSNGPVMVTQANKDEYIEDYVHWLTYVSVKPHLESFLKGFRTLLDDRARMLLTPETLRRLVEGDSSIDVFELRRSAQAKGWKEDGDKERVEWFWRMLEGWDQQRLRLLLKFVTASDRVPAMGYDAIGFTLERSGADLDRLPTSSTCFATLYMPAYTDEEMMEKKLVQALENCEGFGLA